MFESSLLLAVEPILSFFGASEINLGPSGQHEMEGGFRNFLALVFYLSVRG